MFPAVPARHGGLRHAADLLSSSPPVDEDLTTADSPDVVNVRSARMPPAPRTVRRATSLRAPALAALSWEQLLAEVGPEDGSGSEEDGGSGSEWGYAAWSEMDDAAARCMHARSNLSLTLVPLAYDVRVRQMRPVVRHGGRGERLARDLAIGCQRWGRWQRRDGHGGAGHGTTGARRWAAGLGGGTSGAGEATAGATRTWGGVSASAAGGGCPRSPTGGTGGARDVAAGATRTRVCASASATGGGGPGSPTCSCGRAAATAVGATRTCGGAVGAAGGGRRCQSWRWAAATAGAAGSRPPIDGSLHAAERAAS